jgi:putative flippase GtrA
MTIVLNNPRERTRFFRFAMVGVIGAMVDFGVTNLLRRGFTTPLVVAGTISFICAILSNFILNRYWTYPDSRSKPILHQLMQFSVISIMGLAIRVPLLAFLEPVILRLLNLLPLEIPPSLITVIGDNITLAIAVLIVMFWNFFVNRYWTYGDVE